MIVITCIICKKEFPIFPYRLKRSDGIVKCCSKECYWKSKVGSKVSDETKKKMSKSHGSPYWLFKQKVWNKGKRGLQKAWNKDKICAWRGDKHWNWQGGKTLESISARLSLEYRQWRINVFKRDKFTCQSCGVVGGKLEAHHIKPFSKYKELRFDLGNGTTLCKECHSKTDSFGYKAKLLCVC